MTVTCLSSVTWLIIWVLPPRTDYSANISRDDSPAVADDADDVCRDLDSAADEEVEEPVSVERGHAERDAKVGQAVHQAVTCSTVSQTTL